MSCHNSGNAQGAISLDNIDSVRRFSERIRYRAINKKDMPPQQALTAQEQNSLSSWLDRGSPNEDLVNESQFSSQPNFEEIQRKIFQDSCYQCHSGANPEAGLDLENYEVVKASMALIFDRAIVKGTMPLAPIEPLTKNQKKALSNWLIDGAPQ